MRPVKAGHQPAVEAPAEVAKLVGDFLGEEDEAVAASMHVAAA